MQRKHWLAGVLAVLVCVVGVARADLIFFTDGYVLQGKVVRQTTTELDSATGELFTIPRGFYFVDDGPRRVYFCNHKNRMSLVERLVPPADVTFSVGNLTLIVGTRIPSPPPMTEVIDAPKFEHKD